jgi:hypothetical protein
MIGQVSIAAATAVAGYDIFKDQTWNQSSRLRRLRGIAVAGSAAAGDCSFNLYIDDHHVGRFYNTATGWPTRDHIVPIRSKAVPPGAKISAIMVTAPTTNPINVVVY